MKPCTIHHKQPQPSVPPPANIKTHPHAHAWGEQWDKDWAFLKAVRALPRGGWQAAPAVGDEQRWCVG